MTKRTTRFIGTAAVALTLGLTLSPAVAGADTTTTVTAATVTPAQVHAYHVALATYLRQLRQIDQTYRTTVDTAHATYEAVVAKNPGFSGFSARIAARTALDTTLASAADARATALVALGTPPVNPGRATNDRAQDKAYHAAVKAYFDSVRAINQTYRSAVATAESTFLATVAQNQGPTGITARATARITYANAVAAAATVRLTAITALGTPPTPPSA
jgi:hypothetical protein